MTIVDNQDCTALRPFDQNILLALASLWVAAGQKERWHVAFTYLSVDRYGAAGLMQQSIQLTASFAVPASSWGDTVNVAARLESAGEATRINVSSAVYERAKPYFKFESRGSIEVKNKGTLEMFYLGDPIAAAPGWLGS